ncbi:MAG: hypothetical protein ABI417_08880, partial [Coleofasciculaceae cyanobacterium]
MPKRSTTALFTTWGANNLLLDNHLPPPQLVSALTKAGHYFGRLALETYLLIKITSVGIILIAISAHLRYTLSLPVSNDYKE